MGRSVKARCECGLERSLAVGGSKQSFRTHYTFPCLCTQCRDVVSANLKEQPLACPTCGALDPIPYDSPELQGSQGESWVASCWMPDPPFERDMEIYGGEYKCPKCEKMTLRFAPGPCFD
ncbi:MAG: hypothetical protein QGI09_09010 [Dehalococcoidia bacterium]|jgi:hypothetical protein|nr:hypothetical protein [Dehalococcoidia bacterium]